MKNYIGMILIEKDNGLMKSGKYNFKQSSEIKSKTKQLIEKQT